MSRKHLLPVENEEYLDRLGLTGQDKKVYTATLDSGLVSVGEIQKLTELQLGGILESIRDLVNIGLVKKALGKMPRYYASLPFFRETISIEREAMYSIDAMLNSLKKSKEDIEKRREELATVEFPKIIQELLDSYYKILLSPTINEFEIIRDMINENRLEYIKSIQEKNETIKNEFTQIIKPLKSYAELQTQKFDIKVINEGNSLEQYLTLRKANRLKILKSAHTLLGSNINQMNQLISQFDNDVKAELENLNTINPVIEQAYNQNINATTVAKEISESINASRKELQTEILVIREKLVKSASTEDINLSTGDSYQKGASVNEIRENFEVLTKLMKKLDFNADQLITTFEGTAEATFEARKKIHEIHENINIKKEKTITDFQDLIKDITSKMSEVLNTINEQDDVSLTAVQEQLNEDISNLSFSIKQEGKELSKKISDFNEKLETNLSELFDKWQNTILGLYDKPTKHIEPLLDVWVDEIKPKIDNFNEKTNNMLEKILTPVKNLEETTFSTLIQRIRFSKAIIEGRDQDLQTIMEFSKNFDYTKSSDTWVVVGLPSIFASLTDLILRTRTKVTVVTPRIDLEIVEIAKKMKPTIRITLVADIDKEKDSRIIKKIEEDGRIVLRSYGGKDLYACMRDSEEIIFGYEKLDEEMIGIRTSTPSMVALLEDRLNETVIRNSKPI